MRQLTKEALPVPDPIDLEVRIAELEEALWLIIAQAGTMADPGHARDAIIQTARRALKINGE
jgi:hypothetical protein